MKTWALLIFSIATSVAYPCYGATQDARLLELGRLLFQETSLSADAKTSCASCHDVAHAYADPHARSIGANSKAGTRNAPSLVGIGDDRSFAWDGRRDKLEDAVLDPFTNPVELGLGSTTELLQKLKTSAHIREAFDNAFPNDSNSVTLTHAGDALARFVRSLRSDASPFDEAKHNHHALAPAAENGRRLFEGAAGCSRCHESASETPRLTDNLYHHSSIGEATQSPRLPALARAVVAENLEASRIGPKVLTDAEWSSLGRFVVSHQPGDIGAFRTPSLRNVAVTAPYMHDGSIATLEKAVDHEIYYHGLSTGHPVNLTQPDREALVEFLTTLTDTPADAPAHH